MKKEKHLEINENNYKGYAELYAAKEKEKGWNDAADKIATFSQYLFYLVAGLGSIAIVSTTLDLILGVVYLFSMSAVETVFIIFLHNNCVRKTKLQIKEKYPYVDLSLDMKEVEKALKEAKVLVYEGNHVLLDVKSYEQRLESEKEIREGLEKQNNNENKNLDELIKDSEQKIKENTDSMEEYKDNIIQEKIRLEALKRIKQERENQVFSEEKNNIEMPSQEKGLVLRKQKED